MLLICATSLQLQREPSSSRDETQATVGRFSSSGICMCEPCEERRKIQQEKSPHPIRDAMSYGYCRRQKGTMANIDISEVKYVALRENKGWKYLTSTKETQTQLITTSSEPL